ncbi:unnamed protein product [Closterium sp. NIES-53]
MPTRSGLDFAVKDLEKEGEMAEVNAQGAEGMGEKRMGGATGSEEAHEERRRAEKEETKEKGEGLQIGETAAAIRAGRNSDRPYHRSASWQGFEEDVAVTRWRYTMLPKVEVPERFSGEVRRGPSLKNYLMQLENLRARWERDRMDAEEFFRGLANTLTGEAETYYRICRRELLDWAAQAPAGKRDPTRRFLEMLREQFPLQTPERVVEFRGFKRKSGESLVAYYGRLVELAEDMNCVDQGRLVSKFLNGLNYELQRDVQVKIFEMGAAATLGVAYETAKRVETGRRLFEVERTAERAPEHRRPAWSAAPVDGERPPRGPGDTRKCHNCGQMGHLRRDCRNPPACSICGQEDHQRRDCPEAPVCGKCGRRGHVERECYSKKGEGRGDSRDRSEVAETRAEIEKLRAQLEGRESGEEKKPAMVARREEEESSEEDFCLMAWPARDREELGLRTRERNLRIRMEGRREEGPRRRAAAEEEDLHPPRRHPLERLSCAASVVKGSPEESSVTLQCGISPSEDYDLLLGVEFLYCIGATICMWEEKLTYRVVYREKNQPVAKLPVRFIRREPREAYQAEIRTVEEELGILSWERLDEERRQRDRHRQRWGESGRLRELNLDAGVFHKPIVLLELFAGICTGLAAVLKAGLRVEKYIYVENDEAVNCMAWHHVKKLEERYPSQLYAGAVEKGAEWVCHRVEDVREDALAHWGHIDLVVAGWECQGLSRAGEGKGFEDPRSGLFRELVRVLKMIKRKQGEVAYIVENVDTRDDGREAVKRAEEEIRAELGAGVAWDAAQNGSRAHRPRRYWQNVIPEAAVLYELYMMERPRARLVQDILEPARIPAPVRYPDHEMQYPCNVVGKPRQAWPTLVAHDQAKGFKIEGAREGPGMVYDSLKGVWEEPTSLERELAMGFMAGATASGDVMEQQRKRALGNAMDLNASDDGEERSGDAGEGGESEAERKAEDEGQPAPQVAEGTEGHVAAREPEGEHQWNIGAALQGTAATRLEAVLRKHAAAFAHSLQELGKCTMSTMHLPLTSEVPVYQRRRRMSPQDIEACTAKCQELLATGLIRRSSSDYAAATVVAARTDLTGAVLSRRMCGDYRGLNKVTASDRYPMPMAEEIFDQLHGSWVFSTLDLRQGFNQIPIAEEDKRKTAFHGPDGLYEWNYMPFGLRNASAVFQRVMDTVLREVKGAACYIDDVIIFSPDGERHVEDIEATLTAIQAAGLTCHPGKCRFGHSSVAYLGFEVAGGELSIQKAKVEVLDRVGRPRDRSRLRALLGFLNYYRKFIPDFSKRVAPLNKLLREDQKWQWEEPQEEALKGLMEAVKSGAVLKLPNGKAPFVLYTDWRSVGMGAVLSQLEEGQEKVVAFASRTCNPAEANYSSYEGEGLAAVWAVGHFRVYLQGRHFTLVTDHQPLLWLMQNQTLTGRNARWAMKLQEYDFTVKHRPGRTMQHVDGLSRNPPREQEDGENGDTARGQPVAALTVMVKEKGAGGEQERGAADVWQDAFTLAWIKGETAEDGGLDSKARARGQHYRWYQGQVQLQTKDGWKRVPEPAAREAIIKELHEKLGHYGPLRTIQLLQTGWWWAGMRKEVKEWVEKCELCCRNKATLLRSKAELQPLAIVELGYRWSLDIAGELPMSRRGRKYIVLMIEHVSKWAEARPLVNKSAAAVAEEFEEMVITRFGACGEVLTDQGAEFEGEFKELLVSNGIQHRTTSRYHPQADGLTERLVQTMKRGQRVYGEAHKGDWDKKLAWVMAGYSFNKQATLKDVSPYYLLFGKHPILPVGAPKVLTDSVSARTAEKWVALADAWAVYLRQMLPAALESLKVAQLRDIHRYKQRQLATMQGRDPAVEEGEEVYVRRAKRDGLDLGVSQQRWTVKEVRDSGVLVLKGENGKRVMDHVTNVALAGKAKGVQHYSGPMTRARTAAAGPGRGQE